MKSLRRYFCVLLSCVLLLGAFSVTANAEEVTSDYDIKIVASLGASGGSWPYNQGTTFQPNDGTITKLEVPVKIYRSEWNTMNNWRFTYTYTIRNKDGTPLVTKGNKTTFTLNNAYWSFLVMNTAGSSGTYYYTADSVLCFVTYTDGTNETLDATMTRQGSTRDYNFTCTVTPKKDVQYIEFYTYNTIKSISGLLTGDFVTTYAYIGEFSGDDGYQYYFTQQSEEAGLLSGILGWIQNIFDSIGQGFTDMKNGITNIVNKITDLPRLLWEKIETGLKNLFVPDEDYILESKDNWDNLLESKFGALYQVVNVVTESWEDIQLADEENTIYFPEVTIELPADTTFSFGGYEVVVVPEKFTWLATSFKTVAGIIATWAVINAFRRRYIEVLGTGGVSL